MLAKLKFPKKTGVPQPSEDGSAHPDMKLDQPSAGPNGAQIAQVQRSSDQLFDDEGRVLPSWKHQISVRAFVVGAAISTLFCIMVLKLAFTVGIIPSLNIAAGVIGFVALKTFTTVCIRLADRLPWISPRPFTQQEATCIQTFVVAGYSLAFSGGFSSFLLGMDYTTYLQSTDGESSAPENPDYKFVPAVLPPDVIQPNLGRFIGFMFVIGFAGIMAMTNLRKIMVIDYRLTYPSGTATGIMIKGFFQPMGEQIAKLQIKCLGKWGAVSFCWSLFKWFFSGFGDSCGFDNYPSFGFHAKYWKWNFDFSLTYVGVGMICPIVVTYSLMVGAVLSYGIMWPLIENKQGEWFPNGTKYGEGGSNVAGLSGYKTFIAVAFILGDGLFNIVRVFIITIASLRRGPVAKDSTLPLANGQGQHVYSQATSTSAAADADEARLKHSLAPSAEHEERALEQPTEAAAVDKATNPEELARVRDLRDKAFMAGAIPQWVAWTAYACLAAISIGVTPQLWPGVKAYYMVVAYIIAPFFAFCNAYGMGLTDWSMLTTYGKVGIFVMAAWGGSNGGIIAGLATGTAMGVIVGSAADLMQDFKTGWLTFASPIAMFISQCCGMACACIIAPLTFWLYWKGFTLGDPTSQYPAPFAVLYRDMAVLAVQGTSGLPQNCLKIAAGAFFAAIIISTIRTYVVKPKYRKYVPIPMCLGIPAYIGGYFVIDMAVGATILAVYRWVNRLEAKRFAPIIASALIAGDGIWTVVSAILALAGATPPVCMYFTYGNQDTVENLSMPTGA